MTSTVTEVTARTFDPHAAVKEFAKAHDAYNLSGSLDEVAKLGKFPCRPSNLFLQMFKAALGPVGEDPDSGVCSPSLLGTSGVVPLSIISTIPTILQHYHNVIAHAEHEVLLATNAWEPGPSVEQITSAFRRLNQTAGEAGRTVVVKLLVDAASARNVLHARYYRKPDTWEAFGIPKQEEIPHLHLEVLNYHKVPLGTFHSKFMVVDRKIALVNSNNINLRSNVEMCCHFEGEVVNSLYDTFLISWSKTLPNPPGLPCITQPDLAKPIWASINDPTEASVTERLDSWKEAKPTYQGDMADYVPFYHHAKHDPVPMALVNRLPYQIPGHQSRHVPQNEAWLAGMALATESIFIQSPVFDASPIVPAVVEACRRNVTVTLYIDLGFNDLAEGKVPFQGGTNEEVLARLCKEVKEIGKGDYFHWHWYTAKDQAAPLRFELNSRNCHVKFFMVDEKVAIMGSGNMDTQSWFHSQEVNVMIDSPDLCREWKELFRKNQNTGALGKVDAEMKLVSGEEIPKKEGHGGLSRSQGGFL